MFVRQKFIQHTWTSEHSDIQSSKKVILIGKPLNFMLLEISIWNIRNLHVNWIWFFYFEDFQVTDSKIPNTVYNATSTFIYQHLFRTYTVFMGTKSTHFSKACFFYFSPKKKVMSLGRIQIECIAIIGCWIAFFQIPHVNLLGNFVYLRKIPEEKMSTNLFSTKILNMFLDEWKIKFD